MNYLLVVVGGGVGALLRYISTQAINGIFNSKFTLGTFFVNCIGSLLIGFLISFFDAFSIENKWKLLIVTGFLGGYTTYSAYSYETINYIINGNIKYAIINIIIHNILCLLLVVAGIWLNKIIFVK
ncbi:MAG: fluoride efflux transporter CrcB [Treponema sp.]|jgi:CrcB protein|nr:fluoride efflux transporter CrcB [Treponema sp.]